MVIYTEEALRLGVCSWCATLLWRTSMRRPRAMDSEPHMTSRVPFWIALAVIEAVALAGSTQEWVYFSASGRRYSDMPLPTQVLNWLFSLGVFAGVFAMVELERRWAARSPRS